MLHFNIPHRYANEFLRAAENGDVNKGDTGAVRARITVGKHNFGKAKLIHHEIRRRRPGLVIEHNEPRTSKKCHTDRKIAHLSFEKNVSIPQKIVRTVNLFNASGSRMTRSGVYAAPQPKTVHGTFCCVNCGTKSRDKASSTLISMFTVERECEGRLVPSFCDDFNPVYGREDPKVVKKRVVSTMYYLDDL